MSEALQPVIFSLTLFLIERLVVVRHDHSGDDVPSLHHEPGL